MTKRLIAIDRQIGDCVHRPDHQRGMDNGDQSHRAGVRAVATLRSRRGHKLGIQRLLSHTAADVQLAMGGGRTAKSLRPGDWHTCLFTTHLQTPSPGCSASMHPIPFAFPLASVSMRLLPTVIDPDARRSAVARAVVVPVTQSIVWKPS